MLFSRAGYLRKELQRALLHEGVEKIEQVVAVVDEVKSLERSFVKLAGGAERVSVIS